MPPRHPALVALLCLAVFPGVPPALGDDAGGSTSVQGKVRREAALNPVPDKLGYAFDEPRILVRQLMFGLAHGVTLLARACLDVADEWRRPAQDAYHEWLTRYGERIIDSEQALAVHYFGKRSAEATEDDIARALNLPPRLDLARNPERLQDACATFPQALSRKRYNLDLVHAMHRDEQRLGRAIEVRAAISQCREIAAAEQLPVIDAAFARWESGNGAVEQSARERWLKLAGDEAQLRDWEAAVVAGMRRQLVGGAGDAESRCAQWVAELSAPKARLSTLLGEPAPSTEPAANAPPIGESPEADEQEAFAIESGS